MILLKIKLWLGVIFPHHFVALDTSSTGALDGIAMVRLRYPSSICKVMKSIHKSAVMNTMEMKKMRIFFLRTSARGPVDLSRCLGGEAALVGLVDLIARTPHARITGP